MAMKEFLSMERTCFESYHVCVRACKDGGRWLWDGALCIMTSISGEGYI